MRSHFEELTKKILKTRKKGENFLLGFAGERSQFTRLNGSKIRQSGEVEDLELEITLILESESPKNPGQLRQATSGFTLSGLSWLDWQRTEAVLAQLRAEVPSLPVDEFAELPQGRETGDFQKSGTLLAGHEVPEELLRGVAKSLDLAGIYAGGPIYRGMANSEGQFLWFSTENFSLDYSVYTDGHRALKGAFAGNQWDRDAYASEMDQAQQKLQYLKRPAKNVARGHYRTYLAPAALSDLLGMFSWGCMSEASIQQGDSPLRKVRSGEFSFSPLLNFNEDFREGLVPRFNELGEIAPENLPLIEKGVLKNTLISSRTAKEYKLKMNGACSAEVIRSPVIGSGNLAEEDILNRLGTGLYLSNLHYLNWSDQTGGRVTGMTRYACFWVENGKITAPIENLRWDDSIFTLLGSKLEELTKERTYIADVSTYERRSVGGMLTPGGLVSEMAFTL